MRLYALILFIVMFMLSSCEKFALMTTPKKEPVTSHTKLAKIAEDRFWTTLHKGEYHQIPEATKLMTAAYLQNPHDPNLAAHLGFLHIWKITERNREAEIQPSIVNEIILAKKYFKDAVELNPHDARYLGFLGDSMLVEGNIFADERQQVHGYYVLKDAIRKWPEFNYFTAGYPMSNRDPSTWQFQEGLSWQWETLSLCARTQIGPENPNFKPYMHLETTMGRYRACWNSWIAPHNFEGFFMNMGDMLVKAGDWRTAIKIYENTKLSKDYSSWPYRSMLEKRIKNAQANVNIFRKPGKRSADEMILFTSGYGCAACHQR